MAVTVFSGVFVVVYLAQIIGHNVETGSKKKKKNENVKYAGTKF